jgi:hypothetical protein
MTLNFGFRMNAVVSGPPVTPIGAPFILWDTRHYASDLIVNEGTAGNIYNLALNPIMTGAADLGGTYGVVYSSSGPASLLPLTNSSFIGRRSTVAQGPNDPFGHNTKPIQLPTTSTFPTLHSQVGGAVCSAGYTFMLAVADATTLPLSLISGIDADADTLTWYQGSVTGGATQSLGSLPRTDANVQVGATFNGGSNSYKLLTFYIDYNGQTQKMWVDGVEQVTGFTTTWAGVCADITASADELFTRLVATLGTNLSMFPPDPALAWNGVVGLAAFRGTPTVSDITPWRNYWLPTQAYHPLTTPTIAFDQSGNGATASTGSWTVPSGVAKVRLEVAGAGGPALIFDMAVSAGDVFAMTLGGVGQAATTTAGGVGGWPDGGHGGTGNALSGPLQPGQGGSGSTKVTLNGTTLVHLGGKGGASRNNTGFVGPYASVGQSVVPGAPNNLPTSIQGGCGTLTAAGLGGVGGGTDGSPGSGSTGGAGGNYTAIIGAGGGGGGYFGGGGGGGCPFCGSGVTSDAGFGGGGSSYANLAAMIRWTELSAGVSSPAPAQFGNSRVRIAY